MARIVTDFAETFQSWSWWPKTKHQHSFHPYACPLPWKLRMNILAEKVTKNHLKLMDFQLKSLLWLKPNATNGPYVWIYNTSWLEIHNQNYIWKTSVFTHSLQSGWGFRNLTKVIFEHFQGTFSYWVRLVTNMPAYSSNRTRFGKMIYEKTCLGKYGSWSVTIATISVPSQKANLSVTVFLIS